MCSHDTDHVVLMTCLPLSLSSSLQQNLVKDIIVLGIRYIILTLCPILILVHQKRDKVHSIILLYSQMFQRTLPTYTIIILISIRCLDFTWSKKPTLSLFLEVLPGKTISLLHNSLQKDVGPCTSLTLSTPTYLWSYRGEAMRVKYDIRNHPRFSEGHILHRPLLSK